MNHLEIGDTLIFENVGAYSVTEGIYLFLSRTMPRVYLKDESGYLTLVRDAMETSDINTGCTPEIFLNKVLKRF